MYHTCIFMYDKIHVRKEEQSISRNRNEGSKCYISNCEILKRLPKRNKVCEPDLNGRKRFQYSTSGDAVVKEKRGEISGRGNKKAQQ